MERAINLGGKCRLVEDWIWKTKQSPVPRLTDKDPCRLLSVSGNLVDYSQFWREDMHPSSDPALPGSGWSCYDHCLGCWRQQVDQGGSIIHMCGLKMALMERQSLSACHSGRDEEKGWIVPSHWWSMAKASPRAGTRLKMVSFVTGELPKAACYLARCKNWRIRQELPLMYGIWDGWLTRWRNPPVIQREPGRAGAEAVHEVSWSLAPSPHMFPWRNQFRLWMGAHWGTPGYRWRPMTMGAFA